LAAGTLYFFQVAAVTEAGRGPYSLPSKNVTPTGSVTVTFNSNGGMGTMAPEIEPYDTTVALTLNTFTYVGYTFAGWNTEANGSGTAFTDGALSKFNGSSTFYAQWTAGSPTTVTVTFNANGGIGTMNAETENLNTSTVLTTDAFTRAGYTFSGWNTEAFGNGTSYANGAIYAFATSVTLYAQWTALPITQFTFSSLNWSGYVVPSSGALITDAEGNWSVPTLNCAQTPNNDVSVWVGIGGEQWATGRSSGALLQTGTTDVCVDGVQRDIGWWYVDPSSSAGEINFTNFPVASGDEMGASVYETTTGAWETELTNLSTGLSAYMVTGESWGVGRTGASTFAIQGSAVNISYSGAYTAEWIVEDPGVAAAPGTYYPFANFGMVTFSDLRASFSSWSLTLGEAWGIVQDGVTLAAPTNSTSDGFTVTYAGP
jgi:uncharacterized repeat protein (TIGR02543 family)